ncbi:hypothetical protein GCM10009641_72020 [Mycobacterium cookii]|uniref:Uncharacterized protein n=1 Tax=Mycobacterium cookii TaxID=1775 RepID=A0A7I7KVQ9_9MYCO|nr:hypothetical protein [Mycobacterium cookii]MCV7331436.1 hypothetical protein [Mycobacterium cookii]BBX45789.1 hypothetical protein MCOO_18040 [Mycobacterium cookii]
MTVGAPQLSGDEEPDGQPSGDDAGGPEEEPDSQPSGDDAGGPEKEPDSQLRRADTMSR